MNFATVKSRINEDCPLATFPVLSDDDVRSALVESRIVDTSNNVPDDYSEWRANHSQVIGDICRPTEHNGLYYVVSATVGGGAASTGPDEPVWPMIVGDTVADNKVTWQCTGQLTWTPTYDLWYAIALLWEKKASRVAHMTQQTVDGQSFNPQQLRPVFMLEARRARRKRGIRSQTMRSSTAARYPRDTYYR